ncbi:MAG: malonyl-CoA decarboxylase [Pseudomonadota bacterium]
MSASGLLGEFLTRVTEVGRALTTGAGAPTLVEQCEALLDGRGEATGMAVASEILQRYAALDDAQKTEFFSDLTTRFGVDQGGLALAVEAWRDVGDDGSSRILHFASEPRSQELIRRLNRAPGATAALVAMRHDLLRLIGEAPGLAPLDRDFHHLFSSWFNRGFLELRRIDWSTPAAVLEKVIAYEAVHEISGWEDLRRRVAAPDRRLYAFFHPALRDEPLIFVEIALTDTIPQAIDPILAEEREALEPSAAATAAFYSISNCQPGLRGVSFGNFLIKQVVEELHRDYPALKTFVTLSPIPGLRDWVASRPNLLTPAEAEAVAGDATPEPEILSGIAAAYLAEARAPRGGALDPVARFHLGNGARLERINAQADLAPRAQRSSWGLMVNYLYDLPDIERNHEAYANEGEIACSAAIRRLLRAR